MQNAVFERLPPLSINGEKQNEYGNDIPECEEKGSGEESWT